MINIHIKTPIQQTKCKGSGKVALLPKYPIVQEDRMKETCFILHLFINQVTKYGTPDLKQPKHTC